MGKSQKFRAILVTLIVVAAVLIDQIIKVAVKLSMYMHESIPVFCDLPILNGFSWLRYSM